MSDGDDGGVADRLEAYTEALFAEEDRILRELRAEIDRRGWPRIEISPTLGKLVHLLARAVGARRIVEVGALAGYSAIWLARALPEDGELVTFELEEDRARVVRDFARRAGLGGVVEVRVGDAKKLLPALGPDGSRDVVFIDAEKEGYPLYLREAARLLRPGGLVLGDNAYRRGSVLDPSPDDPEARGIRAFNRELAEGDAFDATIVPIRDGLAVGVRR